MILEIEDSELLKPIIETQEQILKQQNMIISLLGKFMLISGQKSVWRISDIAKHYGKAYDTLRTTERYLLPRFGESAFPTGPARWPIEEVLEWMAKPDEEKRKAYQEHVRQRFRAEARKRNKKTPV